jgi:hypothetical protein
MGQKKIIFDPSVSINSKYIDVTDDVNYRIIKSPVSSRKSLRPAESNDNDDGKANSSDVNSSEETHLQVNTNILDYEDDDNDDDGGDDDDNNSNINKDNEIYFNEDLMKLHTQRDLDCCKHILAESKRRIPPLMRDEFTQSLVDTFQVLFPGMNILD